MTSLWCHFVVNRNYFLLQVSQETTARGQPKGDAKFYLKTFDTTVDTKALPLGYTFAKLEPQTIPDQDLVCDYAECSENSITDPVRLNCFHTFHKTCLDKTGNKCPICVPRLSKKISSLCEAFNESIIKPTSRSTAPETTHPGGERDDEINENIQINANIDSAYYESAQWETHIETELNSFTVRQPQGHRGRNVTNPPLHLNVQIPTLPMGTSTFWFLPSQMSQATLMGRNGSNACTFIALFMASAYIRSTNKNILELYVGSPLNSSWITLMLSSIVRGNNAYDRVTLGIGSPFFSVADAKANLVSVLGNLTLEDTLDLSITTTDPQIPQSSLEFYLQRLDREPNLAALVIANGMTICFVGYNNKIYVLDSHPHNAFGSVFGAMVGMTAKPDLEEFLVNIKRQISPAFNVCSLTFVSF